MSTHGAHRAFGTHSTVARVMRLLAFQPLGSTCYTSQTMQKHCPVVLLALAAHHDQDGQSPGSWRGYTAVELAPFVGLANGTVATALRSLLRYEYVTRYRGGSGSFRYVVALTAFRRGSEAGLR